MLSPMSNYAKQLRMAYLRVTRPQIAVSEAVHTPPHANIKTSRNAVPC